MALLSVIRRWHFREEMPIREIERRTGLSRNTIRKYLRAGTVEPKFKVADRPSKLDPFAEKLSGWLRIETGKSRYPVYRNTLDEVLGDKTGFRPATPYGVQQMLIRNGVETKGANTVIVGRSAIVGRPMMGLLIQDGPGGNATVTIARDFAIDTVAPVITVSGVTDGALYAAPVTPTFSATDARPSTSASSCASSACASSQWSATEPGRSAPRGERPPRRPPNSGARRLTPGFTKYNKGRPRI